MLLFVLLQRASLSQFISFSRNRITRNHVQIMLPEMRAAGYINHKLLRQWNSLMDEHNQIIRRGNAIKPLPWTVPEYSDLDLFMLKSA